VRLAWVSPLPPVPSGIADYSFELLPWIAGSAEVDVVCPVRLLRPPEAPPGVRVVPPRRFRPERYDAIFHHLANNPMHEYVLESALRHPGICVFHDLVLHHLIALSTVEVGRRVDRYRRILEEEHGEAGARLAELKLRGVAGEFDKFVVPLAGYLAARARGVVVHSLDSRERLRRELGPREVPVEVIPHHAGSPPPELVGVDRAEARRLLRLPGEAFLVGHLGFLTVPKQPSALVGGFARLRRERPDARLLVVGADATGGALDRAIRTEGVRGSVTFTGWVDLKRFFLYLKAVDCVVSLRYPTAGESSGPVARALGEGRVAIVSNYGAFADLPRDVVLKVEVDGDQAAELGAHLVSLARDPGWQARLEDMARAYAETSLDPRVCRDLYMGFAKRLATGAQATPVPSSG
jgi:glycosyltransferase involved in cell wall biosynthesis